MAIPGLFYVHKTPRLLTKSNLVLTIYHACHLNGGGGAVRNARLQAGDGLETAPKLRPKFDKTMPIFGLMFDPILFISNPVLSGPFWVKKTISKIENFFGWFLEGSSKGSSEGSRLSWGSRQKIYQNTDV